MVDTLRFFLVHAKCIFSDLNKTEKKKDNSSDSNNECTCKCDKYYMQATNAEKNTLIDSCQGKTK